MEIRQPREICTVIVTVESDPDLMSHLEAHASDGLERFARFAGFVSGALHKSADGGRLVQYLQWESEEAHLTCMNDPRWDELPSTRRFMEATDSGRARMDVRIYNVVSVVDAP